MTTCAKQTISHCTPEFDKRQQNVTFSPIAPPNGSLPRQRAETAWAHTLHMPILPM